MRVSRTELEEELKEFQLTYLDSVESMCLEKDVACGLLGILVLNKCSWVQGEEKSVENELFTCASSTHSVLSL
jgi:hypothetical protein